MPSISETVPMLVAALLLMGSPGPATMCLAAAGAAFGIGASLPYLAGIVLGTSAVLVIVATGLTGLLLSIPGAAPVILVAAGAYILHLAWRIASAPPPRAAPDLAGRPSICAGLFPAIANPKAYAAIAAVYSSAVLIDARPLSDAAAKIALLGAITIVVNSAWLVFGAGLAGLIRSPRSGRTLNTVYAILLVVAFVLAVI